MRLLFFISHAQATEVRKAGSVFENPNYSENNERKNTGLRYDRDGREVCAQKMQAHIPRLPNHDSATALINPPMNISNQNHLEILYQDDDIVAINKPTGLLVHRSRIDVHARDFAVETLHNQIGRKVFLVHRLDRPTSGILLFALNIDAARNLAHQFANRKVAKMYRAIVRGHTLDHGRIDEALSRKSDSLAPDRIANADLTLQDAITEFETIRRWEVPFSAGKYPNSRYSEVHVRPETGRKHQIRRHFNHISHPLIGDSSHGDIRHNRLFREHFKVSRLLLIAQELSFAHPATDQKISLVASRDFEFEQALKQLNEFAI